MKRREFLAAVGSGVAAIGVHARSTAADHPRLAPEAWWAWVHGGGDRSPREWRDTFARARAAGIDAVLVSGGETAPLADAAHEAGLAFHRWIWTLNRSGDSWAKAHHPEWFSVSRTGLSSLTHPPYVGYYQWVCPTRTPVRLYLRELVERIAGDPDVDGVHLDYIRYPDVILPVGLWSKYGLVQDRELSQFDFCYCDVCRTTFRDTAGYDPLALDDPSVDVPWREFRWRSVTEVVAMLANAVHAHRKPISAAVFPTPTIARRLVRQAWDEWTVDAVFPMLYHRFYEQDVPWIGSAAAEGVRALPPGRALYAGLYVPDLPPPDLARAVTEARDAGARGVSFFALGGLTDAHLAAVRALAPR